MQNYMSAWQELYEREKKSNNETVHEHKKIDS